MKVYGYTALLAIVPAVVWNLATPLAIAQGTTPPAAASSHGTTDTSAPPKGPSFQSGGLKLTVVTVSSGGATATLSLVLENRSSDDLLVAIIGSATGVTNGFTLVSNRISGVAFCAGGGRDRTTEIKTCLAGVTPQLPLQLFTLIEHGNAIPLTITMSGDDRFNKVDKAQTLGFAMTVAVIKDDPHSDSERSGLETSRPATDTAALPRGLRFISMGIPQIPLS